MEILKELLKKQNIFSLIAIAAMTFAVVITVAHPSNVIIPNRGVWLKLAIIFMLVFGTLYLFTSDSSSQEPDVPKDEKPENKDENDMTGLQPILAVFAIAMLLLALILPNK